VITADGTSIAASKKENAIFSGYTGRGGNFGIVTEFTFQLHSVGPMVYGGVLFIHCQRQKSFCISTRWVRLYLMKCRPIIIRTAPPEPFIPSSARTPMIARSVYTGDQEAGEALMSR